jgi:CrcB protein
MNIWLLVMGGGALGSLARYLVATQVADWLPNLRFPLGTLAVNVVGCAIAGALVEIFADLWVPSVEARAFLIVGVLGGFTTFSAFSIDTFFLIERGSYLLACAYIAGSVVISLIAFFAAQALVRLILT